MDIIIIIEHDILSFIINFACWVVDIFIHFVFVKQCIIS
jgi:hypothetical protein